MKNVEATKNMVRTFLRVHLLLGQPERGRRHHVRFGFALGVERVHRQLVDGAGVQIGHGKPRDGGRVVEPHLLRVGVPQLEEEALRQPAVEALVAAHVQRRHRHVRQRAVVDLVGAAWKNKSANKKLRFGEKIYSRNNNPGPNRLFYSGARWLVCFVPCVAKRNKGFLKVAGRGFFLQFNRLMDDKLSIKLSWV